jgi:hypothetical protein
LISHALAAGISVFELAKIAGTSVRMIEHHYGVLLDGASAGIGGRLDTLEAQLHAGYRRPTCPARNKDSRAGT